MAIKPVTLIVYAFLMVLCFGSSLRPRSRPDSVLLVKYDLRHRFGAESVILIYPDGTTVICLSMLEPHLVFVSILRGSYQVNRPLIAV